MFRISAIVLIFFASSEGFATSVYPNAIKDKLGLSAAPDCTLCHDNINGGTGTATSLFAQSMKTKGLVGGGNTSALNAALDALGSTDSDGDGTSDLDELKAGRNPNVVDTGNGTGKPTTVTYGCSGVPVFAPLIGFAFFLSIGTGRRKHGRRASV